MTRRRPQLNVFGLSFLDVICCGFGAALLLFILVNTRATRTVDRLQADATRAETELQHNIAERSASESIASLLEDVTPRSPVAALSDPAWASLREVVVVLDRSGSMSAFLPDRPEYAERPVEMKRPGVKWERASWTVAEILSALPALERFSVRQLTDRLSGRVPGEPIWPPRGETAPVDIDQIRGLIAALVKAPPRGGSNHYLTLESIFDDIQTGRIAPDAIVLVMDGLPNHGPVFASQAERDAANLNEPDNQSDPSSGLISLTSRERRADRVINLVHERLERLRASGIQPPLIHCVLLPWPDDPGLVEFALELAGPTGGRVVAMTPGSTASNGDPP